MENKTTTHQQIFDLHIEYSQEIPALEGEMRNLEAKFLMAFGFPAVPLHDWAFSFLPDNQQQAVIAFWKHSKVRNAKMGLEKARMLADAYFTAYVNTNGV